MRTHTKVGTSHQSPTKTIIILVVTVTDVTGQLQVPAKGCDISAEVAVRLRGKAAFFVSWGMREWSRKQQKCTKTWEKPVICKEYPWSFKMFKGMVFWGSKFFLLLLSQGIPLIWKAGESSWSFPSSFKITPKSWVTKKKRARYLIHEILFVQIRDPGFMLYEIIFT